MSGIRFIKLDGEVINLAAIETMSVRKHRQQEYIHIKLIRSDVTGLFGTTKTLREHVYVYRDNAPHAFEILEKIINNAE